MTDLFKTIYICIIFAFLIGHKVSCQDQAIVQEIQIDEDTFAVHIPKKILKVGYYEEVPIMMKKPGKLEGMSAKLWQRIAEDLKTDYEYVEFSDYQSLRDATEKGIVDVAINPFTVSAKDYMHLDFSQPIIISNLAIAIRAQEKGIISQLLSKIFTWEFVAGVGTIGIIILIFGLFAWMFERKSNQNQFPNTPMGVWESFWWSAVTMTTVGYGDKSPKTTGGRVVALIWMFTAVIIIASYTATISSSLTVDKLSLDINSFGDLYKARIITDNHTDAKSYLSKHGINSNVVTDPKEALNMVINGEADAYVADELLLRYMFEQDNYDQFLSIAPGKFLMQYYAFALPRESDLLRPVNLALMKTLRSAEWRDEISRFVSEKP